MLYILYLYVYIYICTYTCKLRGPGLSWHCVLLLRAAYVCEGRTTTNHRHQERYIVSLASLGFEGTLYRHRFPGDGDAGTTPRVPRHTTKLYRSRFPEQPVPQGTGSPGMGAPEKNLVYPRDRSPILLGSSKNPL